MIYTYLHAICNVYPTACVEMNDPKDFTTLTIKNKEEVGDIDKNLLESFINMKNIEEPFILLRKERNLRLVECDWIIMRALSTGQSIPIDWSNYMQALRNLPETENPKLNMSGNLDVSSVNWPIKPS
jgi:hypothetical protein